MDHNLQSNLQMWHENDEFQKIVEAIKSIPECELDYNLKGQLARAYNNIDEYQKALDLLLEIKNDGENDVNWHFRVGYANYFLDEFDEAKSQFKRCLELEPNDEDTIMFLKDCNDALHFGNYLNFSSKKSSVPSFLKRCDVFWNWFDENEEILADMVKSHAKYGAEKVVEFISVGTNIIADDVQFKLGGDYEFTFVAEGKPYRFYLMPFLVSRMPEKFKNKWHFLSFAQGCGGHDFDFEIYEKKIKFSDVLVHIDFNSISRTFSLIYFNEQLNELDYDNNINAFCIMLEIMTGEALSFVYVSDVDKLDEKLSDMFPLTELENRIKQILSDNEINITENPAQNYCIYKYGAENGGEFRMDTEVGTSCYQELVSDFYNKETNNYDSLLDYGAFPLYIAISFWENRKSLPNTGNEIIQIRHEIEDRIQSEILGERGSVNERGIVIGGAMGIDTFYIDLLLYDMEGFEEKLEKLLEEDFDLSYYLFNFRRGHKI